MKFIKGSFKALVILFLIALVIVIGVASYLAFFFDINKYKSDIEQEITKRINQDIKIAGEIKISNNGINPALSLPKVTITTRGNPSDKIYARNVNISLSAKGTTKEKFSGTANIKGLIINGVKIGNLNLPIKYNAGEVVIKPITGKIFDGKLSGDLVYENSFVKLNTKVKNMDYSPFIKSAKGRVDIDAKLQTNGKSVRAVTKNLNGQFNLVGENGQLPGTGINLWAADLLPQLLPGGDKDTKVNCIVARFDIKDGIAHSKNFLFDTKQVTVTGKGSVNLAQETVNLKLDPKPKKPSLISMATKVRLTGRFDNIKISADKKDVAKKIGGLALGIVNPALLAVPLAKIGSGGKDYCLQAIKGKKESK